MLEGFLPTAYIYMNAFILAFGVWGIIAPDSVDSIFMVSVVKTSGQTILLNDRSKRLRSIIDRKANLRSIICRFFIIVKFIGLLL